MYELIEVTENTYYMDCPSKVGIVRTTGNEVVLIDSGSDKDAGKKVKRILDVQGWQLTAIFNTHSHADHIGGNRYLQAQTGCRIFAPGIESCFTEYPVLEPVMLYGGCAPAGLRNKFLMAEPSRVEKLSEAALPKGMEAIPLPGHCFDMTGFRTKDGVVFLADCLSSRETLEKYRVGYLYDVKAYLDTLEKIKSIQATCFIPAHAGASRDIAPLAQFNIDTTLEIADTILGILSSPKTFDDILAKVFNGFGLTMTLQQNALIGSTVRSYISYLCSEGKAAFSFENGRMLWKAAE